jgi:NitT/TauT family transport system substrate-binding protein
MKLVSLAVVTSAALVLAACSTGNTDGGSGDSSGASGEPVTMLLSYQESIYWLPLLMAKDQGYFADEGLDVNVEATEGSGFVTQQVIAGNVDFGWAGAADDVIAFSKDDQIRALICNPPQNIFRIVVLEDSPITDISQLEGKVLGITEAGGGEEPIVDAALGDIGLAPGTDVTILPIGAAGPQSLTAIQDGTVDAYASSYPDISTLNAEGLKTRDITPEKFNAVPGDCLITRQSVLDTEEGKADAIGIMRAWAKGAAFAEEDPDRAYEISCTIVPAECSDEVFAKQYLLDTIAIAQQKDPNAPFGSVTLEAWETTAKLLVDAGTITGPIDVKSMVSGPGVDEVLAEYSQF